MFNENSADSQLDTIESIAEKNQISNVDQSEVVPARPWFLEVDFTGQTEATWRHWHRPQEPITLNHLALLHMSDLVALTAMRPQPMQNDPSARFVMSSATSAALIM